MTSNGSSDTPGAAETDTKAQTIANTSGITPTTLSATLKDKLQAGHVVVEDISGTCTFHLTSYNSPAVLKTDAAWLQRDNY